MADERLTNKERRAQARAERKRKEAEAARRAKRNRIRTGLVTAVIVAVVAGVVLQALLGGPDTIDDPILISTADAEAAREAAGCEVLVDGEPYPDSQHYEAAQAPPADTLYPGDIRPTHSGPHTSQIHPPISDGARRQIDEVSSTHNLEHGAVIVWYDPDQVDGSTAGDMGSWAGTLNANGFQSDGGSVIFVSPYEEPGISSGKAVAYRAWGVAMDCDTWDETVANSFVIDNYGTQGIAPERMFAGYPEDVLAYEDQELEETTEDEAPLSDEPTEGGELETEEPEEPDEGDDG